MSGYFLFKYVNKAHVFAKDRLKVQVNHLFPELNCQLIKGDKALMEGQCIQQPCGMRISAVIPTLNEAQNLHYVLPFIPSIVSEVILVDGNSTDDTIDIAQQLLPTIRIIKQRGKGKGNALKYGFAACTGDIIVMLDADGSADPNEIPSFIEALLRGYDFAKGSRFVRGGGSHDITPLRRRGNSSLCKLVNMLFKAQFSDLCYGYNAFWRHCLDYIEVDCDGFEVETFITLRVHQARLRIVEVPSVEYRRIHGQSNLRTFRDGWRVLKAILRERTRKVLLPPTSRELGTTMYSVTGQRSAYE